MLLADKTVVTHNRGVQNANQFSIQQSAKMFNILSNSLYSDKIMAVIRELSTNAYDSHIASNNPNPFRVKLPTDTDPNFMVRDYGTGLSKADMENLYTTYGASNKNTSNDFVGCLGLGSKSPFAYTKSFTTSSYFNGQKFMYVAAMDETGVPSLNHVGTFDTDEPNGLEISFAVNRYDCNQFASKAKRVFHYFKNKPILEGSLNSHDYSQRNVVVSGDYWKVCRLNSDYNYFPNAHHNMDTGVVAIMGNIAYPVEINKIIGTEEKQDDHISKWNRTFKNSDMASWKTFLNDILSRGMYLELDFNIGELEMDPARESLQYTKDVVKLLRQRTQGIYADLKQKLSDKIATAKNKVEAYKNYYTLSEISSGWGTGASWTDSEGKTHTINANDDITYKMKGSSKIYAVNYRTATYRSRRYVYQTNSIHYQTLGHQSWRTYGEKNCSDVYFFQCDVKSEESAKKIVTKFCNQKDCYAYLLVSPLDSFETDFEEVIKDVGSENILKVSDYKHLNYGTRSGGSRDKSGTISTEGVFLILGDEKNNKDFLHGNLNDSHYLRNVSEDEFEDADSIIYIPIVRYASAEGYPCIQSIALNDSLFRKIIGDDKIYAIKQSEAESLKKNDSLNLVDFKTYFVEKFTKYIKKHSSDYSEIANLVKYCQDNVGNFGQYRWANDASVNNKVLHSILRIFGLNYNKYINSKEIVSCLDVFFLIRAVKNIRDITYVFPEKEVLAKLNNILHKLGCPITFSKMMELVNYNSELKNFTRNVECLSGITISETDFKKYDLPEMKKLVGLIKKSLDSNVLLKYTIGVDDNNGEINSIIKDNPTLDKDRNDYSNQDKSDTKWFHKIDVESLRVTLGNTIL